MLLLAICVLGIAFAIERTMADFDGIIDIDEDNDPVSQNSERIKRAFSSDIGEDDEDDYGSVMSDESGSGSGEETTEPSIVDVTVVSPTTEEEAATTKKTTTIDNEITESSEEPTEEGSENELTDEPTDGDGDGDDMFGGGVSETDPPNDPDSPNAEARVDEKSVLRVLTTEVIAAVVVGAVCAVILIAFLVYRLRKRDEGSYALSDAGYKDTYKLQGDTGKEAFV